MVNACWWFLTWYFSNNIDMMLSISCVIRSKSLLSHWNCFTQTSLHQCMYITLHATLVTLKFFPSTINPCVYDTDAATINSFKNRHEIRRKCQMDIVRLNVYKSLGCTTVLDLWRMIDDLDDCTRCSRIRYVTRYVLEDQSASMFDIAAITISNSIDACILFWNAWALCCRVGGQLLFYVPFLLTTVYPSVSVETCSSVVGVVFRHLTAGLRQFDTRRRFITSLSFSTVILLVGSFDL